MKPILRSLALFGSLSSILLPGIAGVAQSAEKAGGAKARLPYSKISHLIATKCEPCHNSKAHPEKIDLSSYNALMKSGEHGPIAIAGHPEKSKLIQYVDGTKEPRMPYKKAPLSDAEIKLLKDWIAAGAGK